MNFSLGFDAPAALRVPTADVVVRASVFGSTAPSVSLCKQTLHCRQMFSASIALAVFSARADSIVVCVARESRWFTKWQRCRITNQLRDDRLQRCSGKLETLLRGSVCIAEFIPTRFRICRS